MYFQNKNTGIGTAGATGIALMVLHILGYLTGWAWPLLYVLLIIMGIGEEQAPKRK
jgi:hypothetical protein